MADVTLTYKGNTILELDDSATKSIKTAGKYLEDDIGLDYVKSGGGGGGSGSIIKGISEPNSGIGNNGNVYLQYCELPAEYQQVEYLGITKSSAYFPISFSPIEINDIIEVEVMDTATTTSEQGFVGVYSGGSAWEIFFESGNIKFYGNVTGTSESYEKNEKQTIRGIFKTRTAASSFNFGFYRGTYYFTGRLYGLRIYSGRSGYDKTITWCKLVPCYLKSNNTPGFYDVVNSVFYTKTGSGAVEIGPDVPVDNSIINSFVKVSNNWQDLIGSDIEDVSNISPATIVGSVAPTSSIGKNGDYYKLDIPIPDNINFVEYLESTGTQYINTGIYATQDIDADVKGDRGSGSTYYSGCMLGVRTGAYDGMTKALYFGSHRDNSGGVTAIKTGNTGVNPPIYNKTNVVSSHIRTIKNEDGTYTYVGTIDGLNSIYSVKQSGTWQSDMPICIFAFYQGTALQIGVPVKVMRATIYDSGVPIADYLPCLDTNNVACMWDNISKTYVYNSGTGDFVAGSSLSTLPHSLDPIMFQKINDVWQKVESTDYINNTNIITKSYTAPQSSNIDNGNAVVILESGIELLTKPICQTPSAGIAGQNQNLAINALNATGANTENVANWATANYNYSNLWVGADFGNPIALNSVVVGCRTWDGRRQIYTLIFEASNDAANWTELGKSRITGNKFPATGWYLFGTGNTTTYRYYRIRTETSGSNINGSVTFTINGLGFLNYQTALPFGTPYEVYYKNDDTLYIFNS